MRQHISRRELKQDEVRKTLAHGAEAVLTHQRATLYILIAAIVVATGVFGWKAYVEHQTVKASAAFDEAMKVFSARIRGAGDAQDPAEVTYVDEKNKYSDAAQKFGAVAAKYPHTRPGQLAIYFAALSDEKIGKNDDARRKLQELSSGSDDFAAMARFELAQLDAKLGQSDEAVKLLKQLIDKPSVLVPKPVAMLALAELYAKSNPSEAAKLYAQIKTEFPDTPVAQQADQELALLPGKG